LSKERSSIIYRLLRKSLRPWLSSTLISKKGSDANEMIAKLLNSSEPAMIGRVGSSEMAVILTYLGLYEKSLVKKIQHIIRGGESCWTTQLKRDLLNRSGFFCKNSFGFEKLTKRYLEDCAEIDILASWLPGEKSLEFCLNQAVKIAFDDLKPFFHEKPWTLELTGRRVLVIHPFSKTIMNQYNKKREVLHLNHGILPEFELMTYSVIQSMGVDPLDGRDWFANLRRMEEEVSQLDFDIALVGAGAYGLPLSASLKRKGFTVVHLGGMLQLMFGIKGLRWDQIPLYSNLYNEHWVYPSDDETPKARHQLEKGAYWKG